ncbi:sensor histidine kinase [Metabacillus litoralis]|uniref:sensor histidine kinase n=1 Tax=Metabacillus litoralis TaxID=152268 RepID=UPI001CFEEC61|nr:HAMP domain-containing sensor histidine kinase [Metabacillus litoralis]
MNFNVIGILLSVQWIVITILFVMYKEVSILTIFLYIIVSFVSSVLVYIHFQFRKRLKQLDAEIKRARSGNYHTKLLANDDPIVNEIIFSVNDLIEKLENLQSDKAKSEASRKSLLSSISHDIRTPLTSIIGYVDAIKQDIATTQSEKEKYLEIVSRKSNNLKSLIEELFNLAKLDADELTMKMEQIDFTELTREILIEFLPQIKNLELKVEIEIPDSVYLVEADYFSVVRIVSNLIKNAITYGKSGNVLGVKLFEDDEEYQLIIWDRGPGLTTTDLEYVFEKMYRVDSSRNLSSGGSGLGLAIAKALIEKNNGRIWAESIPSVLTTFAIALPKCEK